VASQRYLVNRTDAENNLNVINLLKQTRLERKKEKRRNILLAAVTTSALIILGLIISL